MVLLGVVRRFLVPCRLFAFLGLSVSNLLGFVVPVRCGAGSPLGGTAVVPP